MKRYLICSIDEPVTSWEPRAVYAETADDAVRRYVKEVYSKDPTFRGSVFDLAVNMTFVEQFYHASDQEQDRFNSTGTAETADQIVKARVRQFFGARPDLGERYVLYMDTEDRALIDDDMFEFIAENESPDDRGFVALDPDAVAVVAA